MIFLEYILKRLVQYHTKLFDSISHKLSRRFSKILCMRESSYLNGNLLTFGYNKWVYGCRKGLVTLTDYLVHTQICSVRPCLFQICVIRSTVRTPLLTGCSCNSNCPDMSFVHLDTLEPERACLLSCPIS
jgi:hypothetical protein